MCASACTCATSFVRYIKDDDERPAPGPAHAHEEQETDRSFVVALLKKETLTDEQIAEVLTLRTDGEIRHHVAAMDFRKCTVRVAVLYQALVRDYPLPPKYRQHEMQIEKARQAVEQLALNELNDIERRLEAQAKREIPPEERRAALPESMRRQLATVPE